jgi:hypothetical protein
MLPAKQYFTLDVESPQIFNMAFTGDTIQMITPL